MRTKFILELSCDIDDEQQEMMENLLRESGLQMFALATLTVQRRPPQIMMRTENAMIGNKPITLEIQETRDDS